MRTMRTKIVLDMDSIVLHALRDYYSKSKSQEIRRAILWSSSNNEKGEEIAPATFQRCIKRLEKLHVLHCNRIANQKFTVIVFNKDMVNITLKRKEEALNLKFQNITEEIEPETWEPIFESTANKIIEQITSSWASLGNNELKLRYGESTVKKALCGIASLIMSRSLEVLILQDSWNEIKSERKEAVEDLIRAVGRFTSGYPNEPFTITIQFNGFQKTLAKVSNEIYPSLIQKIAPYLIMFSERVVNHRFSKQDSFFLKRGRIESLSAPARRCFDIFMNRMSTFAPKSAYNVS
jgi:hypothetical protein